MYQIVIPIDKDERRGLSAVDFVTDLGEESGLAADPDNIAVSIINVYEKFKAIDDGGNVQSEDLYDEESFPESVIAARDRLVEADVAVDVERRHGDPGEEILDHAASIDADTIVVPGRKRSPVGKALFGSVTQEIILNADIPVTIV